MLQLLVFNVQVFKYNFLLISSYDNDTCFRENFFLSGPQCNFMFKLQITPRASVANLAWRKTDRTSQRPVMTIRERWMCTRVRKVNFI